MDDHQKHEPEAIGCAESNGTYNVRHHKKRTLEKHGDTAADKSGRCHLRHKKV